MSQHTPGPWEAHPAPYGWDIWAGTPENFRQQWVAPVTRLASPHSAVFDGSIEVDAEMCAANARLMAAAPDLLAALREANALILAPAADIEQAVLALIRAAIRKASAPHPEIKQYVDR